MPTDLSGLRVLVVGAAAGIGAATVDVLREHDAQVFTADLRPGGDATCDITDADDCRAVVDSAAASLGGLDGVVVTVGGAQYIPVTATDVRHWNAALALNLTGPALLVGAAQKYLERSTAASVVTVGSAAGLRSYKEYAAYGSAKAGLVHFTKIAAREFAPAGVRVNCVSPGPIDTDQLRATQPSGYSVDEWLSEVGRNTAMARVGTAREVAEAIVFLLSPRASFITGAIVPVDGGESC